jgi:hypothetical protein
MNTKRYHKDVYLPKNLEFPPSELKLPLTWTGHALDELRNEAERYGVIKPLPWLRPADAEIIEAVAEDTEVKRVVYRLPLAGYDLILVVTPERGQNIVRTAWANDKNDLHRTLDVTKYEQKPGTMHLRLIK